MYPYIKMFGFLSVNRLNINIKLYVFLGVYTGMSQRYYPTVMITVDDVDFDTAERALDRLRDVEVLSEENHESKYERKRVNGDTEINGYIKLSLDHPEIETEYPVVHARYNSSDQELSIHAFLRSTVDPTVFSSLISLFGETIKPEIESECEEVTFTVTTQFS